MASTSLLDPPPRALTLQSFPFSGLVGAALLALASVTIAVTAVTDAVDSSDVEKLPPAVEPAVAISDQ